MIINGNQRIRHGCATPGVLLVRMSSLSTNLLHKIMRSWTDMHQNFRSIQVISTVGSFDMTILEVYDEEIFVVYNYVCKSVVRWLLYLHLA